MSKVLRQEQCPQCAEQGLDSSGDNLAVYENGSYCFACGYSTGTKMFPGYQSGQLTDLPTRKINKETMGRYAVRTTKYTGHFTPKDYVYDEDVVIFNLFKEGKLVAQKLRLLKDKSICTQRGLAKDTDMFGLQAFTPSDRIPLVICEAEIDAMTVNQVSNIPAIAVGGAQHAYKKISQALDRIQGYKHIILCFDEDEAGRAAVDKCLGLFKPGTVRVAHLPLKDANEMLQAGREDELKKCIWNAEIVKPATIVTVQDIRNKVLERPVVGLPWHYQAMTDVTYGLRGGEIYVVAAAEGVGKCLAPQTKVIMFNGEVKEAKDVLVGDLLMGPDSKPRQVLSTISGEDTMYKVCPIKGDSYVVNSQHILTLQDHYTKEIVDKPILEVIGNEKRYASVRTGVEFQSQPITVDPYIYGLWLGDGTTKEWALTNSDPQILDDWCNYVLSMGGTPTNWTYGDRCITVGCRFDHKHNPLKDFIKYSIDDLGLKTIRKEYTRNSSSIRLQLLAGLLDTDGYLMNKCYEIATKSQSMSEEILFLARSLGFMATIRDKIVKGKIYKRIFISGDVYKIPCRLKRRICEKRESNKDTLVSGIKIEKLDKGKYVGFVIDGDKRFLLGDFQITHNTEFVKEMIFHLIDQQTKIGVFSFEQSPESTVQRLIGSKVNKRLHLPGGEWWDEEVINKEMDKMSQYLYLYDNRGALNLGSVLTYIRYLVNYFGVKFIVLDNLTALCSEPIIDGRNVGDAQYIGHVMLNLHSLVKELRISICVVSHLNDDKLNKQVYLSTSPKNKDHYISLTADGMNDLINKPGMTWESGRMPTLGNIYGSGTVKKLADYVIVLARNRVSKDPDEHSKTIVKFLKCRLDSKYEGHSFNLFYNYHTGRLEEQPTEKVFDLTKTIGKASINKRD